MSLFQITLKKKIQKSKRRFFVFKYPSDGYLVKGYISYVLTPENSNLLIKLRGGSGFFGLESPADFYNLIKDYTVVGTTYRGGISEGRDEYGGQDVNDVLNLIKFITKLEEKLGIKITLKKKFLLGSSRGGNQMFLALNCYPPLQNYFDKVLSLSAPLDLKISLQYYPELREELVKRFGFVSKEWLSLRNPMENIDNISPCLPILIVQGGKDIYVPIEAGKRMYEALREKGCDVEYIEVEEGSHCLMNLPNLVELVSQWLEK